MPCCPREQLKDDLVILLDSVLPGLFKKMININILAGKITSISERYVSSRLEDYAKKPILRR